MGLAVAIGAWAGLSGWRPPGPNRLRGVPAQVLPGRTIETTKETIEWVREQTPLAPKS